MKCMNSDAFCGWTCWGLFSCLNLSRHCLSHTPRKPQWWTLYGTSTAHLIIIEDHKWKRTHSPAWATLDLHRPLKFHFWDAASVFGRHVFSNSMLFLGSPCLWNGRFQYGLLKFGTWGLSYLNFQINQSNPLVSPAVSFSSPQQEKSRRPPVENWIEPRSTARKNVLCITG